MKDIVILIPAYNPNSKLLKLILELIKLNFIKIIIINDGSTKSRKIFKQINNIKECILLEYDHNKGKGYALKYGINYYLENYSSQYKGIVTVDADYQHLPNDIINISYRLLGNQDSLILGVRNFKEKNVPIPNAFGNKLTSRIFKLLYGQKIDDTQTGLRGIPNRYLNLCLEINGSRFEYEMNMLIKFVTNKINILQIPIYTVYSKENKSHFDKILDSIRIYTVLFTEYLKFTVSSLICSFFDIILFTIFIKMFTNIDNNIQILVATILARIVTDFFNFNINKSIVFKSRESNNKILVKYYILSIFKMLISAVLVLILHNIFLSFNETILKILVDILLFILSYKIQKKYVFKT